VAAQTKPIAVVCSQCGGTLQRPAELVGTMFRCPYCRKEAELLLPAPEPPAAFPKKTLVWSAVAFAIIVLGLAALMFALKQYQAKAPRKESSPALRQ
jgi:hypothetical protein